MIGIFSMDTGEGVTLSPEDIKFGGEGPMKTHLKLSTGPLIMMIIMGLHDIIDVAFTKKVFNKERISIVVICATLRLIIYGLSVITSTGEIVKTTQLVAENKYEDIGKLFVDVFRLNILVQILIPAIFIPTFPKIAGALGITDENMNGAKEYVYPVIFEVLFIGVFQNCQSILIGLARANLCAIIQFADFIFSAIVADAIVIFAIKGPLWLQGSIYYGGQVILGIVFAILFFAGKFGFKTKLSYFISKPSRAFWESLKLCAPNFTMLLLSFVSNFVYIAFINNAGENIGCKADVATVASAANKPEQFMIFMVKGSNLALQSAGTWAVGKGLYRRARSLFFCSLLIPLVAYAAVIPILMFQPHLIMSIFIDTKTYARWVRDIVPKGYYLKLFEPINESLQSLLLACSHGLLAAVPIVLRHVVQSIAAVGIYYGFRESPDRVAFGATCGQAAEVIAVAVIAIFKLRHIFGAKSDSGYLNIDDEEKSILSSSIGA